jgi:RHS repeat-associated protein
MPDRTLAEASSAKEDYTGHERDAETGLHYAGARYYMSALGRWTTPDPLLNGNPNQLMKDGKSRYLGATPYNYVFNNPTGLVDPTGMAAECPPCDPVAEVRHFWNYTMEQTVLNSFFGGSPENAKKVGRRRQEAIVKTGAFASDVAEDGSLVVAGGALVAAPFTGGGTLPLAGTALQLNVYAGASSTAFKTIDAAAFDGSPEAALNQGLSTFGSLGAGAVTSKVASRFAVKTGTGLFRNPATGRFVSKKLGRSVITVRDATNVGAGVVIPEAIEAAEPFELLDPEENR